MADRSNTEQDLRPLTWAWWLLILAGVLGVVAGAIVLAKPGNSLATIAVVSGVFILIESIVEVFYAAFAERSAVAALLGVLGIVIGILLIRHPVRGASLIGLVIGLWLIAVGVIRLATEISAAGRAWSIVVAAIEVVAGVVIVASPHIRFATLALAVGVSFIANGLALIALGWMLHAVRAIAPEPAAEEPGPAV